MKFGYVILYVDNVELALEFYERALGLKNRMLDDTKRYGELETGDTRLALAANELVRDMIPVDVEQSGPNKPAPPFELAMVTEDVDSAFGRALAAGAALVKSPENKPWGQIV